MRLAESAIDRPDAHLLIRLRAWVDAGALRALDLALTHFVAAQGAERDASVLLAVALTSERNGHGHVCLDLAETLAHPEELLVRGRDDADPALDVRAELRELLHGLTLSDWVARLRCSLAIDYRENPRQADRADDSPLVLAGTPARPLLYLRRYWRYESRIRDGLAARLQQPFALSETALRTRLDALFCDTASPATAASDPCDWQKIACALAARSAFVIVTGGPGTGKTTTVVRLLALLQGLAIGTGQPPLRICLAAPTGKAAARLNESIAERVASLPLAAFPDGEAVRRAIPTVATTLHRLLGTISDSRRFRHHAGQPLAADLVVVDEASMVDVELMANLLDALRPAARLILLGDKDQLASVEAGAVLGDLCQRAREAHYTPDTCAWLQRVAGATLPDACRDPHGSALDQSVVMLRTSYRFRPEGGIGALAALVNEDSPVRRPAFRRLSALLQLFERQRDELAENPGAATFGHIAAIRLQDTDAPEFAALVLNGYRDGLARMRDGAPGAATDRAELDRWARALLADLGQFQLLCALRHGPWGVEEINRKIVAVLSQAALLALRPGAGSWRERSSREQQWFAGRPVRIVRNDYSLNLMNGDIGIALAVPLAPFSTSVDAVNAADESRQDDGRVLRVAFPAGDGTGGIRWMLPSRLQDVETAFAMTVHQSQGSEFAQTALILPDTASPVLTRELLYTGITRAKNAFTLLYREPAVVGFALERRIRRVSGLQF